MKNVTLLFALIVLCSTQGVLAFQIEKEAMPSIVFEDTQLDASLDIDEAKYVFTFRNIWGKVETRPLTYSIDGIQHNTELVDGTELMILTSPGKHIFQLYYSSDYYEVYSDSLEISPQHLSNYSVYLERSDIQIMTEKPVIYLYPEAQTIVNVKLKTSGELTFTYPEYKDGWDFAANPNGDLIFGENTYNYLFCESSERYMIQSNGIESGFHVKGDDATSFLKEKLTEAGLTSKEQTDFITYWAPRMAQNELNFVRFEFNETCNRFAELDITPKPDNLYRIYMLWFPTNMNDIPNPQKIETVNRDGFTVIEWGGQELPRQIYLEPTN